MRSPLRMALLLFFLALFLTLILAARAESARQERDSTQFPPPGQIIKIGNLRLHINCKGSGSPTVILDAGLGDSSLVWDSVQPKIASFTRVCSYDRAGLGWSDPDPHPRPAPP